MKHQKKWLVLVDRGDKLVERIIPAKTERQAVDRCQTRNSRVIGVRRYEGVTELDKPGLGFLMKRKKETPA